MTASEAQTPSSRFTSLIATPPAAPSTSTPDSRASAPEPWDEFKARAAHKKLLKHDAEQAIKVYAVIDAMLGCCALSAGERLRLRGVLVEFFYTEVSVESIERSIARLAS